MAAVDADASWSPSRYVLCDELIQYSHSGRRIAPASTESSIGSKSSLPSASSRSHSSAPETKSRVAGAAIVELRRGVGGCFRCGGATVAGAAAAEASAAPGAAPGGGGGDGGSSGRARRCCSSVQNCSKAARSIEPWRVSSAEEPSEPVRRPSATLMTIAPRRSQSTSCSNVESSTRSRLSGGPSGARWRSSTASVGGRTWRAAADVRSERPSERSADMTPASGR